MRIGVLILSLVTLAFLVWLGMTGGVPRASVEVDAREGAYADPRRILARIQSDLERTAAGHHAWPLPKGVAGDPLEAIVDAYRLFLDGNAKGMDARLKEIAAQVSARLGTTDATPERPIPETFATLAAAATAPEPASRLLAALRQVDALLFLEATEWRGDAATRTVLYAPGDPVAGTWLRLPCRTVIGRVAALKDAQARLGALAGPLLACPSDHGDLAVLEAQAKAPAMLPTRTVSVPPRAALPPIEPSAPPLPWGRETAAAWMDEDPDAAEAVLAADASPGGKLDYALFLHAFRPAGPDNMARILAALRPVEAAALAHIDETALGAIGRPAPYDGSDQSLLTLLRLASSAEVSGGAYYVIPCAVLRARPLLLDATRPQFGSNRDNFLPRSGCQWGRGTVRGFPDMEVEAYRDAATEADGRFLATHGGSMVHALASAQNAALERLKVDPRGLAAEEPPAFDHPYQVWGLTSLGSRAVETRIKAAFDAARSRLAAWYLRQGLTADEAARAAKTGLFHVVWGADCGGAPPTQSLRGLLLDKTPLADIRAALAGEEAPEVTRCAEHAGLDPLLLVAVGHPQALALLLERGANRDERNSFGKTALMTAAQFDMVDSARLLLERGASANATTWMQDGAGLAHDGRTALMYAAAHGSLAMVKLLLERGADPHLADTKGRRAIDYLLGFGPTAPNGRLSADERAEAARLLY